MNFAIPILMGGNSKERLLEITLCLQLKGWKKKDLYTYPHLDKNIKSTI